MIFDEMMVRFFDGALLLTCLGFENTKTGMLVPSAQGHGDPPRALTLRRGVEAPEKLSRKSLC